MRTYLILRERAKQWHADAEIQALVASVGDAHDAPNFYRYSQRNRDALLASTFDRAGLAKRGLAYERLDQLTMEVLLGVRCSDNGSAGLRACRRGSSPEGLRYH